jgi:quercetin dioxygenase-like cupin family protein
MVTSKTEISNLTTGQRMIFRQTSAETRGERVVMENIHPPHKPPEPLHVHPFQTSSFQMLAGCLHVRVNNKVTTIGPGDRLDVPPNVPHTFWNEGDEEAHEIQTFQPGLNIDDFFTTYFALTQAGKIRKDGMPDSMLLLAVLMQEYDQVMRVLTPPRFLQVFLMWTLGPVGRLLGYRKTMLEVAAAPHARATAPGTR